MSNFPLRPRHAKPLPKIDVCKAIRIIKLTVLILNGNPRLYEKLFAQRDDITLGNPFGPLARGRAAVVKTLAGAAAKYRDGSATVDLVAKYADDKMACIVEVENNRAKVGGTDTLAEFHVRVTSLYERIDGAWQLVHRHAEPITTPRPAESVLQK